MKRSFFLLLTASLAIVGGCSSQTATYCETHDQCPDTGHCDVAANVCVESPVCDCGADAPICDDGVCRACQADNECAAFGDALPACGADGACVECNADSFCDSGLGACSADNTCIECSDSSDCQEEGRSICSEQATCVECVESSDCAGASENRHICTGESTCVECETSSDCSEPAAGACEDNSCRACQADSECASGLCLEDEGVCVESVKIVYASTAGADGPDCGTQDAPCKSIGGAQGALPKVGGARKNIVLQPGTYLDTIRIENNPKVDGVIVRGAPGVIIAGSHATEPVVRVSKADATFEDLEIVATPTADGLICQYTGTHLTLRRVTVRDGGKNGVVVEGGKLSLLESAVENFKGKGILYDRAPDSGFIFDHGIIEMDRSRVSDNLEGGLDLFIASGTIHNSVIRHNSNGFFGVGLSISVAQNKLSVEHTTVISKISSPGVGGGPFKAVALFCGDPAGYRNPGFAKFRNTIIDGPIDEDAKCTVTNSLLKTSQPGVGNFVADPRFVAGSYRLETDSPAIDKASSDSTSTVDFEGNPRPYGPASDLGAYEWRP